MKKYLFQCIFLIITQSNCSIYLPKCSFAYYNIKMVNCVLEDEIPTNFLIYLEILEGARILGFLN